VTLALTPSSMSPVVLSCGASQTSSSSSIDTAGQVVTPPYDISDPQCKAFQFTSGTPAAAPKYWEVGGSGPTFGDSSRPTSSTSISSVCLSHVEGTYHQRDHSPAFRFQGASSPAISESGSEHSSIAGTPQTSNIELEAEPFAIMPTALESPPPEVESMHPRSTSAPLEEPAQASSVSDGEYLQANISWRSH
jgi:hypothetical protein